MTILFATARAVHFLSLMAAFGAAAFSILLDRHNLPGLPEERLRVFFPAAVAAAFVSAILWLVLAAARMTGDPAQLGWTATRLVVTATEFGRVAVWRILGLGLLFAVTLFNMRARTSTIAGLAALLLASLALTSHAAASAGDLPALRAGNDAMHLLAAGFWVGGLVILAGLVRQHHRQPQVLAAPFLLFSRWGTAAVVLLIFSGIVNAASILPVRSLSTGNRYAEILAVKITLALCMVGLAVVNRLELVPALGTGSEKTSRRLARSVTVEILLGMLVIGIVGYLGQMAPA